MVHIYIGLGAFQDRIEIIGNIIEMKIGLNVRLNDYLIFGVRKTKFRNLYLNMVAVVQWWNARFVTGRS